MLPVRFRRAARLTIAGVAALALTLTLAPSIANAATRSAQLVDSEIQPTANNGTEIVKNGTFAQGVTGWRAGSSGQTLVLREGSQRTYASVWAAKGGSLLIDDAASTVTSTKAGTTYVVSADVRTHFSALKGQLQVTETKGSSVTTHKKSYSLSGTSWKTVSFTFTAKTAGSALNVSVVANGAKKYQPLQVDNISLKVVKGSSSAAPTPTPTPTSTPTPTASATPKPTASATPTASPRPTATTAPVTDPTGCKKEAMTGTQFGVTLDIPGGMNLQEAWNYAKTSYGTPEVVRIFHPGAPTGWAAADVAKGATLSVSFKIEPKDILSGAYDAKLRSWFRAAPDDVPIYWTYFHEPEDNVERGKMSAADYRAAWQRIVSISRETCQPNLHSTLILMDWTVDSKSGRNFYDYYPGSSYIDVLAWDPYNPWQYNTEYRSPASIFDKVIAVANREGKPFAVAETGSQLMGGDNGTKRGQWLKDVASYLEGKGALYVAYFDTVVEGKYDWRLKDAPSKAAWKSVISG